MAVNAPYLLEVSEHWLLLHKSFSSQQHEDASVQMFDYLVEVNNIKQQFLKFGLTDDDMVFIKELIAGPQDESCADQVSSSASYEQRTR